MSDATRPPSPVVLARAYRPRRFDEMVGQPHVVRALTNALATGRLHHAYLFTGTRGIGKTTISRILAKSLNCTGPDGQGGVTAEPCGVCEACRAIDADRFIDYVELDAASNRSIDEVRELIERAAYKPTVGRYKVFMIDEAHQLTKDAFNALLKTLEEPPAYLKFVLATTDPEKMLPTVLSRCLQFNLRPMAPDVVQAHLSDVLTREGIPAEPGALRRLAKAARGSMRDALSLTDQAIAFGAGTLTEDGVCSMLGSVDGGHVQALLAALARRDGPALLEAVDALRSEGTSARGTLTALAERLQQMALEQAVPGSLDASDPEAAAAREAAGWMAPDETQLLYGIVVHGLPELSLLGDEHAALTMVLLRMLAFPPADGGGEASAGPSAMATRSQPLRVPAPPRASVAPPPRVAVPARPRPASVAPPRLDQPAPIESIVAESIVPAPSVPAGAAVPAGLAPTPVTPSDGVSGGGPMAEWIRLVEPVLRAERVQALARALAVQAEAVEGPLPLADGGQRWRLRAPSETLRQKTWSERLAAALSAQLGAPVQIEVIDGTATDSLGQRWEAARRRREAALEQAFRADPLVQALLDGFPQAQIVEGSIKAEPAAGSAA